MNQPHVPEPGKPAVVAERYRSLVENIQDYAILMLDTAGHVISWNLGAETIKGYTPEEIIGSHFSRFYPAEAVARNLPAQELEMAAAVGRFEDEGWRLRKDGSRFWANVIITAIRNASGHLIGFSKITRNLTERRRHEEDLRQSEERFRLLVEGVTEYALMMLDKDGFVSSWNAGVERIKGYKSHEILGKHVSHFYPSEAAIQSIPADPRPALVAVTGWGQEYDKARATEAGFQYHFVKPINENVLREILAQVAAQRPGRFN